MPLYALEGVRPDVHADAWVAPTAVLIGRVRLAAGASVWWNAVLRGDNEWITIEDGANVQDNAVGHTDPGAPLTVGPNVTVGHAAILHGCTIEEGALVGMGAAVLNHATVGAGALVGACALVPEGKSIPAGALAVGAPAKVVRELSAEDRATLFSGASRYVANARRYRDHCEPT